MPATFLCVIVVVFLFVSIALAASPSSLFQAAPAIAEVSAGDLSPNEQAEVDELTEVTIKSVCVTCHPVENIIRVRREPPDWAKVMTTMATLGAKATPDQFRMIRRYLTRYYGVIHVNRATSEEFSAVLGYTPADAAAIVVYRQAHGPFADLDALARTPGIDRAKFDEQAAALRFD